MKHEDKSIIRLCRGMIRLSFRAFLLAGAMLTPIAAEAQHLAYVTQQGWDNVSVIDTTTNAVVATIQSVGKFPRGVAITPDGAFAYVVNQGSANVSVIDINLKTVVGTINLAAGAEPLKVAITPDGAFAYVPNPSSTDVFVIDTVTNTVVATVEGINSPGGLAITPDGTFVYVTNLGSNKVSVIDTTTNAVVATVEVEFGPHDIAIGPLKLITVAIDIKPGDANNSINPKSNGEIPVAILAKDGLDVFQINPATIRFGKTGEENSLSHYAFEDVDKDGDLDLMLHFKTKESGIQCGDTKAYLKGTMMNGLAIKGSDSVRTVGCK